ncbi:MAG: pyridoxal phosphate-dependent aminotransferase family protein [Spirochaetales bacterium]|nr:pyridoxal phosphate-dependent aminotransferase family protein [Spirochaetales bacterium]
MANLLADRKVDKRLAGKLGFNPYYPVIESGLTDPLIIGGEEFVNLAANNYLGLTCDPRVVESIKRAADRYGSSLCGTPIATGYAEVFRRCEKRLAGFLGLDNAVLFPSCYQANGELFRVLASREDCVLIDHYAHASLAVGAGSAGCKVKPFMHNNMRHLEKLLERRSGFGKVFVVTESVFSTRGTIAPFRDIVELCGRYEAIPVIDDSHGIGTIGETGRGILEYAGITNFEGIYTASLGKALAHMGGVVAGTEEVIDFIRYRTGGLIYSTALPPLITAGILEVLDIIETEYSAIAGRVRQYKEMLESALLESGFTVGNGGAPIISVRCGSDEATILLAKKLYHGHILTTPFITPSVPPGDGTVRMIAGANLSYESIQKASGVLRHLDPNHDGGARG